MTNFQLFIIFLTIIVDAGEDKKQETSGPGSPGDFIPGFFAPVPGWPWFGGCLSRLRSPFPIYKSGNNSSLLFSPGEIE